MSAADIVFVSIFLGAPIVLVLAFLTEGFTSFFFFGRGDRHTYCEKCGRRVERISDNETPLSLVFGGYDATYKCKKCGHVQIAHCYVYD